MVIDDEKINLDIARLIFRKLGVEIEVASDGQTGIQKLTSTYFDLLYLDYYMPEMDGITLMKNIRNHQIQCANPDLYVVATTGATSDQDREMFLQAGMQAIVHKPLTVGEIQQSLQAGLSGGALTTSQFTFSGHPRSDLLTCASIRSSCSMPTKR